MSIWRDPFLRALGMWDEDGPYGCWIWRGRLTQYGYGTLSAPPEVGSHARRGPHLSAHRMLFEQYRGPVPPGLDLDHLCRNRACVNPAHLEPVTRSENLRRGKGAKLTADRVAEMRRVRSEDGTSYRLLAERFGISRSHARNVCLRIKWAA